MPHSLGLLWELRFPFKSLLFAMMFSVPALAQSATEAMFVLKDIQAQLPGIYDSEPQIFLENAFGASEDGLHERVFLQARSADGSDLGEAVFLMEWHHGGEASPIGHRELWSFNVDKIRGGVRMNRYRVSASGEFDDSSVNDILVHSSIGVPEPCPALWLRGQSDVYAVPMEQSCPDTGYHMMLGPEGLWMLNVMTAASGSGPAYRRDGIHTKLFRATRMECFVNIVHEGLPTNAGLDGRTLINPVYLHDRGDSFTFQTTEENPRTFVLMLRKAMWPSRSGRNFVPMLMLWLYRDRISPETIEGSAWAAADSSRVAFDARGVGARCKIAS